MGERRQDPHLGRVQFILSDDLDGDLAATLALNSLVDIGESTVTHLFNESEALQTLTY